jgi:hypothetical protein
MREPTLIQKGRWEEVFLPPEAVELRLELQTSRKFHLARVGGPVRSRTRGDGSIILDVAARITEVDMVERVEGIRAELQRVPADEEVLHHRHVGVEQMRSPCIVASAIADGI